MTREAILSSFEQFFSDKMIEAANDDTDLEPVSVLFAFKNLCHGIARLRERLVLG
jgi:hypothetical protein